MENLKQYHTLLNRLLLAQMYRTEAYRKASDITTDPELRRFFRENLRAGELLIQEISLMINPLLITEAEDTDLALQYQRVWAMLPDILFGTSKNIVLDNYLMGENLTFQLYAEALNHGTEFPATVRKMLTHQQETIRYTIENAHQLKVSRFQTLFRRFSQIKRFFFQRKMLFQ